VKIQPQWVVTAGKQKKKTMFKDMIRSMELLGILPTCQKDSASIEINVFTTIPVM
jgi:hypothetical protein